MAAQSREWFAEWFDSEYYHLLYKNRDDIEAEMFMDNLSVFLNIQKNDTILDIPCGKGRHAIYLASKGFKVTGADLSQNSIQIACRSSSPNLDFIVQDMRKPLRYKYKFVLNLFTSFGYFDSLNENVSVLVSFKDALEKDGFLVLDYLNSKKTIKELVAEEEKVVDGINFKIKRFLDNGVIVKEINFEDKGHDYYFQERVRAYTHHDFINLFELSGLTIVNLFGDYHLSNYIASRSERMIFVLQKS